MNIHLRIPCKWIQGLVCGCVVVISFYIYTRRIGRDAGSIKTDVMPINRGVLSAGEAVGGKACVRPEMELWPRDMLDLFKPQLKLHCSEEEKNWVYIGNASIYMEPGAVQRHGGITCDCSPIHRVDDYTVYKATRMTLKKITNGTHLPSDFISVNCTGSDGASYRNIHSGVVPIRKQKDQGLHSLSESSLGLNILIIGFDSVSRLMWQRNLPKTYKYLTETLGAVVLEGYNVVGDGTTQQLLPILTGKTDKQLPTSRRGDAGAVTVDSYPWIWNDFKQLGYVTQWAEDAPGMGTFTYRMLGFKTQPVDHYMRSFYMYRGMERRKDKLACLGSLPTHLNMFNWGRDLFESYRHRLKFSFIFHSELSHNFVNFVKEADTDLTESLRNMNERGYLDNTLLMVMSDHGARFTSVRKVLQGKYEERNPFFSVRLPPKLIKKYPEMYTNLKINSKRLTTPFDIHETLDDVVSFKGVAKVDGHVSRGISLFQEVPSDRTCAQAEIPTHWCLCLQWAPMDANHPMAIAASRAFIKYINQLTSIRRDLCEELSIDTVVRAETYSVHQDLLHYKGMSPYFVPSIRAKEMLYQIQVMTSPGGALFESTVTYSVSQGTYAAKSDAISRINMYGEQSHCITDQLPRLGPYCYCKKQ